MYSSHDLLNLFNSEKADELKLRAGKPPVLVVPLVPLEVLL